MILGVGGADNNISVDERSHLLNIVRDSSEIGTESRRQNLLGRKAVGSGHRGPETLLFRYEHTAGSIIRQKVRDQYNIYGPPTITLRAHHDTLFLRTQFLLPNMMVGSQKSWQDLQDNE